MAEGANAIGFQVGGRDESHESSYRFVAALFLQIVGHKNNQQKNKGEFLPFRLWLGCRTFAKETCCLVSKQIVEACSFQVIQTCQAKGRP